MAIDRYVVVAFGENDRSKLRAHSLHYKESAELPLQELIAPGGTDS